ncbi:hypothetical protein [Rhodovulum steppense]|uniref:hypothetical protein n=1 Tax=Rhodovulum steppense TaxID=540251 RepID=UPI0014045CB4|nr:hypothetical protein [Rhodovulum steppense]
MIVRFQDVRSSVLPPRLVAGRHALDAETEALEPGLVDPRQDHREDVPLDRRRSQTQSRAGGIVQRFGEAHPDPRKHYVNYRPRGRS